MFRVTPARYVVGMKNNTLAITTQTENLMAMTNREIEAWFGAGGLTVEVVATCQDPECADCLVLEPTREAA